ncbi:hypothetical protein E1I69_17600 [Bacillus timonensis]|uniref:Uncharacterized protein n=1 Tax=Bacillus timonensis TaxID=1033734 RepID=A0A4S3PMK5_9BACI|nr:hypothetical protein [Bacillus timonensis]THE10760.1 hypothetical protein E1I69_17600 [Bacillus timonensis]
MKEAKKVSYISMFFGGTGTILILLGAVNLFDSDGDLPTFYLVLCGFLFTINYINYLESKAGVSKKATWSRAILSIIVFFIVSHFIFY